MSDSPPRVPLSLLELVPVSSGMTAADALREATELAVLADELAYTRLWVAEHHGSETFMASATAVILAHFAERTRRIRLGSGGVMLPNHSPLMVAEYYGTLATLYGDRIDLGLGRAPGTDQVTAAALRRGSGALDTFAADVLDLSDYLGPADRRSDAGAGLTPGLGLVRALPGEGTCVPLWMLGSSTGGAQVAAALGLPFSFASHFAPREMAAALRVYRDGFRADAPTATVARPTVMAGMNVLVAPTRQEAEHLFTSTQLLRVRLRTGQVAPLDPPVSSLADVLPPGLVEIAGKPTSYANAVGTPDEVVARIEAFVAEHELDEVIVATYVHDPALRRRSVRMLAEAWFG